ncbi:hypothetical protein HJB83_03745 [Rhizobium sp. NZLR11]|nr:hypothetical protein [Rhizobium sp. NZLR11]
MGSVRDGLKGLSGSEPVEGGQPFDRGICIGIAVDFGSEIAELIIERFFANLDPPGFGTAVDSVGPVIASRLEVVLHVEAAVLGKYLDTRPLACFIEFGESGGSRPIDFPSENRQKRETIIDSPMTILEVARLHDEVSDAQHEAGHHDRSDKLAAVERRKSR